MIRQFSSLLFGLFIVVGVASAVGGSILPEGSLVMGASSGDGAKATQEVPKVIRLQQPNAVLKVTSLPQPNVVAKADITPAPNPRVKKISEQQKISKQKGSSNQKVNLNQKKLVSQKQASAKQANYQRSYPRSGNFKDGYLDSMYTSSARYFQSAYSAAYAGAQDLYSEGYRTGKMLCTKQSCSHCQCFGCCCYDWQAYVGPLYWQRTSPAGGVTVTEAVVNGNGATALLNSNGYDFGWNNGWEIGVAKRLNCLWVAEANFYRIDSFDTDPVNLYPVHSDNGAAVEYRDGDPMQVSGSCDIGSTYSSELTNLELNLRRHVSQRIDLVAGFRYLQLNDRYQIGIINGAETFHSIHAFNNMYGFHIGPDILLYQRGPFYIDWEAHLGVYGNRIDTGVCISRVGSDDCLCRASQDHTTFSADMELSGIYQYNNHLAFRFGYEVLWLEGVSEATAQIACSSPLDTTNGSAGIDTDGSPFYHGAFFDVVVSW